MRSIINLENDTLATRTRCKKKLFSELQDEKSVKKVFEELESFLIKKLESLEKETPTDSCKKKMAKIRNREHQRSTGRKKQI